MQAYKLNSFNKNNQPDSISFPALILMPLSKFQGNISIIDKGTTSFSEFLSHARPKMFSNLQIQDHDQQNLPIMILKQQNQAQLKKKNYQPNPQDFLQKKSYSIHRYDQQQKSYQSHNSLSKLEINKTSKVNPTQLLFFQQDNIKNSHNRQLVVVKSVNELPAWLFEHIRKQNVNRLKNVTLKEQSQLQNNLNQSKTRLTQRYLNKSMNRQYIIRSDKSQLNSPSFGPKKDKFFNNNQYEDKVKQAKSKNTKKKNKQQAIFINEYDYPYCPDVQKQQAKHISKLKNIKSNLQGSFSLQRKHSGLRSHPNQYRIRYEQNFSRYKLNQGIQKPQPTLSQQEPLVQPKKFFINRSQKL